LNSLAGVVYAAFLLFVVLRLFRKPTTGAVDYIVAGRRLTLPAFTASLVTTWYGGILGVGEYTWTYGISNWLVFGVPYYLYAGVFAFFLAARARRSRVLTLPDLLEDRYGRPAALAGAGILFVMTAPAAYVLMLGVLVNFATGWPLWVGVVLGTLLSISYVFRGGLRAVVATDVVQFFLMFLAFLVLVPVCVSRFGAGRSPEVGWRPWGPGDRGVVLHCPVDPGRAGILPALLCCPHREDRQVGDRRGHRFLDRLRSIDHDRGSVRAGVVAELDRSGTGLSRPGRSCVTELLAGDVHGGTFGHHHVDGGQLRLHRLGHSGPRSDWALAGDWRGRIPAMDTLEPGGNRGGGCGVGPVGRFSDHVVEDFGVDRYTNAAVASGFGAYTVAGSREARVCVDASVGRGCHSLAGDGPRGAMAGSGGDFSGAGGFGCCFWRQFIGKENLAGRF